MGFSTDLNLSGTIRLFLQSLCRFSDKKSRPSQSARCIRKLRGITSRLSFRRARTLNDEVRIVKMQPKKTAYLKRTNLSCRGLQRDNFKTVTSRALQEMFTNHESIPSLDVAYESFKNLYQDFEETLAVDDIRAEEFGNLEENAHVCLDYSGYGLFSHLQQELDRPSCSFGLAYTTANLPAHALYGGADEGTAEFDIKKRIMKFLKIQESEYSMVFTSSRGCAFKLLAESYPFHTNKRLLTVYDYENQGVTWMEEVARKKGASIMSAHFWWPTLRLCSTDLKKQIVEKKKKTKDSPKGLFVFPLQSRVSGRKYSYQWMSQAQENGWHVLFDASTLGPKLMDSLGLSLFQPDFIISSFYKVYGSDPTGFGCLFIKNSAIQCLHNSSAARGVGMVKIIPLQASSPDMLHTAPLLEEQECHEIEEKDEQDGTGLPRTKAQQMKLICIPSFSGPVASYDRLDKCTGQAVYISSLNKETMVEHKIEANPCRAKYVISDAAVEDRNSSPASRQGNQTWNKYAKESEKCHLPAPTKSGLYQCDDYIESGSNKKRDLINRVGHGKVWGSKRDVLSEKFNLATDNAEEGEGSGWKCGVGEFGNISTPLSYQEKIGSDFEGGASQEVGPYNQTCIGSSKLLGSYFGTKGKVATDAGKPEPFSLLPDKKGLYCGMSSDAKKAAKREPFLVLKTLEEQQAGQGSSALLDLSKSKKDQVPEGNTMSLLKSSKEDTLLELEGKKPGRLDGLSRYNMRNETDPFQREGSSLKQVTGETIASCETEKPDTDSICSGKSDTTHQQETERNVLYKNCGVEGLDLLGLHHLEGHNVDENHLSFRDANYISQQWSCNKHSKDRQVVSAGEGASCVYHMDGGDPSVTNSTNDVKRFSHEDEEGIESDVLDETSRSRREPEMICRALNHADCLSLSKMNNRHRYLVNWFVASMLRLRHPGPDNAIPLAQIYGPKVKFDRGASVAFNLFDWKGVLLQPILVQRLADRNNISLGIGSIHHVQLLESNTDSESFLECRKSNNIGMWTSEGQDMVGGKSNIIKVLTASLGFLTNFEDVYRLWAFVAKFLDADFVSKEVWRYRSLNQEMIVVGM